MATQPKLTHGGKRAGAGRPRVQTVAKTYKLTPATIDRIRQIAESSNRTESAVAEEFLRQMGDPTLRMFTKPGAGEKIEQNNPIDPLESLKETLEQQFNKPSKPADRKIIERTEKFLNDMSPFVPLKTAIPMVLEYLHDRYHRLLPRSAEANHVIDAGVLEIYSPRRKRSQS